MSAAESSLDERYAHIKAAQPLQQAKYSEWVSAVDGAALVASAAKLGLDLDLTEGHISYASEKTLPDPPLCFDLMYVRHGKTTGNTEPRVYQGYVDEPSNALNEIGLGQAEEAADKLDALGLKPDLVILSPLARAKDTGKAFLKRHPELEGVTEVWDSSHEMAFGDWDNVMVKDLPEDSIGHLFYLNQNAVVKSSNPYVAPAESGAAAAKRQKALPVENFVDVLVRMRKVLDDINARMEKLATERTSSDGEATKPPLVLMYGHSMAGAAVGFLTGNAKVVDGGSYLGFDGKYILPNATPVFMHRVDSEPAKP